jgi:hypothetical protein
LPYIEPSIKNHFNGVKGVSVNAGDSILDGRAKKRSKPTLVLVQAATQHDPYDTTDYHAEDAFENYHVRYSLKGMDSKKGIRNRSKTASSSAQRGRCNP